MPRHWFISENPSSAQTARQNLKSFLGEDADMLTFDPGWFPIKAGSTESFRDDEGRLPMQEILDFLNAADESGSGIWIARPVGEGLSGADLISWLALHAPFTPDSYTLRRHWQTVSMRYLGYLDADVVR